MPIRPQGNPQANEAPNSGMSGVRRFSHLHAHCSQCPPCPPCPQEPHVNRKCRTEGEMSHRRLGEKQIYFQALSAPFFLHCLTVGTQSHGNTVLCEVTCCSFVGLSGRRYHTKKGISRQKSRESAEGSLRDGRSMPFHPGPAFSSRNRGSLRAVVAGDSGGVKAAPPRPTARSPLQPRSAGYRLTTSRTTLLDASDKRFLEEHYL